MSDSLVCFILTVISLALVHSMVYNPRRLETISYALSIVFLQHLIKGNEDVFLICPQFPLYVSPKDNDPSPDVTMSDSQARGVYVDQVLLLPRASAQPNVKLSFRRAHTLRNLGLYRSLRITSLEIPLLEEKKRPPTRHPSDLHAHVTSIRAALEAAQSQVTTQAKILFSSARFAAQDLVVLVASSGEYYRLAVLPRGHRAVSAIPASNELFDLFADQEGPPPNMDQVVDDLISQLVLSARTPTEREEQRILAQRTAERAENEKQVAARTARASARSERQRALLTQEGLKRSLSQVVIDAGEPEPYYSDTWIEAYHKIERQIPNKKGFSFQRYSEFFEPEPQPRETLTTLSKLKDPEDDREIVFTGVIRIGSQTSEKFSQMIRQHLSNLAQEERSRRKSII